MATDGEIGRRIRLAREGYRGVGMKQIDLAKRIGVSHARLSNWELGKHDPQPLSVVNQIASLLDVPAEYLMTGLGSPSQQTPRPTAVPGGKIKLYGAVSAGDGNASPGIEGEVFVPIELCRQDYGALVVEGDSMMPFLQPSDIAVFADWSAEKIGHVVAAKVRDEWLVKLMVYEDDRFILRSLNPKYKDVEGPYRVAGYLVGFIREDGPERTIRSNPYGLKP